MLIKRAHQKNVRFVTIGILKILVLSTNHIFAMAVIIKRKKLSFSDVGIIYVKGIAYRIHFWYMSEDDAISIMISSNLVDKKDVL